MLLGVLALGFLIVLPISTADWRVSQEDRYVDALSDRADAQLALDASRRVRAAVNDDLALEDMATWGFDASNIDVARVLIEDRLVRAGRDATLANMSISTDDEVEAIGPTLWLGAEIEADLMWSPTFAFLDKVAAWPEGFRVVSFSYELTPPPQLQVRVLQNQTQLIPTGKVRMRLSFPVDLANDAPSTDGARD